MILRRFLLLPVLALLLLAYLFWPQSQTTATFTGMPGLTLIAHAGGGLAEGTYSNSREAFDSSAELNFSYIETDLNWTRDGELVLIHDWHEQHFQWYSRIRRMPHWLDLSRFTRAPSVPAFAARKMNKGLTQMTLDDLLVWMDDHPGISIVTDIKDRNLDGLAQLASQSGALKDRFIPQIYTPDEYAAVRDLGFTRIIFTAYRSSLTNPQLAAFAADHPLFALTVPAGHLSADEIQALHAAGTPVLMHTVNDPALAAHLAESGVTGLYTDYLFPSLAEEAPGARPS